MTPDKARLPTPQATKSLPKHQRFRALMLMVASLVLLGIGVFFARDFLASQKSLKRAAQQFLGSDYVSRLSPQDVKDEPLRPTNILIQKLDLTAAIVPVAVAKDGTLQVPASTGEVGWFINGAKPGENGTAVLTGHLDSATGPAVFWKLKNLRAGDNIQITRGDNSVAVFRVDSLKYYSQDQFPAEQVYRQSEKADLRLITCAGTYDKKLGRYSKNLVVYASLTGIAPKPG